MSSRTPSIKVNLDDTAIRAKTDEMLAKFTELKKAAGESFDETAYNRYLKQQIADVKALDQKYVLTERLVKEQAKLDAYQKGGGSGGAGGAAKGGKGGEGFLSNLMGGATGMGGGALGALMGGAAVGAGALTLGKDMVSAAESEQAAQARLQISLKNSGLSWKDNQKSVEANMAQMRLLGVNNDTTINALSRAVTATHNMTDAQHLNAIALDVARARGTDFLQTQQQMIRAYNGQTTGLKRLGIEIPKGVTGTQALMAVQKQFHGQAQAAAQTTAGRVRMLKAEWDNLEQTMGKKMLPIIGALVAGLARVVQWIQSNWPKIQATFAGVFAAIAGYFRAAVALYQAIWSTFGGAIMTYVKIEWAEISSYIKSVLNLITGVIKIFTDIVRGNWGKLWQDVRSLMMNVLMAIPNLLNSVLKAAGTSAYNIGRAIYNGIANGLSGMANLVVQVLVAPINAAINVINGLINTAVHLESLVPGSPNLHIGKNPIPQISPGSISIPTIGAGGGGSASATTTSTPSSGGGSSSSGGGVSTGPGAVTSGGGFATTGGGGATTTAHHTTGHHTTGKSKAAAAAAAAAAAKAHHKGGHSLAGLGLSADQQIGAQAIIDVFTYWGVDPVAGISIAYNESTLRPTAVGDGGTSFGLFQLHIGGALPRGWTRIDAFDPHRNATLAATALVKLGGRGKSTQEQINLLSAGFERPRNVPGEEAVARGYVSHAMKIVKASGGAGGTSASTSSTKAGKANMAMIKATITSANKSVIASEAVAGDTQGSAEKYVSSKAEAAARAAGQTNAAALTVIGDEAVVKLRSDEGRKSYNDLKVKRTQVGTSIKKLRQARARAYVSLGKTHSASGRSKLLRSIAKINTSLADAYATEQAITTEMLDIGKELAAWGKAMTDDNALIAADETGTSSTTTADTTGGATSSLDVTQQAQVAFAESAESFIKAAFSPSDLGAGTGGSSAWNQAGGQTVTVNLATLVPTNDPNTLAAIAKAVRAAFTQQPFIPSTSVTSGA